jgi:UDP-glucose:(heptosyl)LPS alpha-1,3-glucosyltransferase
MKPKVAIIIERADADLGGAERSINELADALTAVGCDVHVLAAKGKPGRENTHILCADIAGKRTEYRVFADALKKHIEDNHYDIIHSVLPFDFADIYQPRGGTYAESIIRNSASYCNTFVAGWKKAAAFLNLRRNALLRAEKRLCSLRKGPRIAAISQYVSEQFGRHYGVDGSRITVIHNGVKISTPDADVAGRMRAQILNQLGVKEAGKPVLFLFAANNFRLKGLDCLLKAMKLIPAKDAARPVCLVVAGRGKAAGYRRLAANFNVLFLGSVSDITCLLAATDVAVLPTFYDPCSRFILEALAAGKPVITTRFNGAAELFTNNRHGRVIDSPDDITALADAVAHFTETGNIQKASQAIRQDNIKQRVSISRSAGELKKLYDNILLKRRQR